MLARCCSGENPCTGEDSREFSTDRTAALPGEVEACQAQGATGEH